MSLFGSLISDVEDDPFFGSHLRHMRQMNNMMNSLFSDPFGLLDGGGPLAITGPRHGNALMPFMPQMPSLNRLYSDLSDGHMGVGSSYSSSTVVMSNGPNGNPQVFSSTSSTKIGPNGIKETRNTLQDSRTGRKKMSIGHHIGERAHLIEREHNFYSGDAEETQEFINLEEEQAEEFDREFQVKAGAYSAPTRRAIAPPPRAIAPPPLAIAAPPRHSPPRRSPPRRSPPRRSPPRRSPPRRSPPRLTLPTAPSVSINGPNIVNVELGGSRRLSARPAARRPIRTAFSPLTLPTSASVRETYGSSHPQRHRHKSHKTHRYPQDN